MFHVPKENLLPDIELWLAHSGVYEPKAITLYKRYIREAKVLPQSALPEDIVVSKLGKGSIYAE